MTEIVNTSAHDNEVRKAQLASLIAAVRSARENGHNLSVSVTGSKAIRTVLFMMHDTSVIQTAGTYSPSVVMASVAYFVKDFDSAVSRSGASIPQDVIYIMRSGETFRPY